MTPIANNRTRRKLMLWLALLCVAVWGVLYWQSAGGRWAWLTSGRAWVHGLHQELRSSGMRVNGAVEHAAQTNRALADDDAIAAAVADAFAASQSDDLRALQIDTRHAMVTLRGTVASADLRERAIALAQQVKGVHGVFSLLSVAPAQPQ